MNILSRKYSSCFLRTSIVAYCVLFDSALYVRGDPYERSDAVFGVKSSLLIDLEQVDEELATQYQVSSGSRLLRYDFVLVTEQESAALRQRNSNLALERLGRSLQLIDGLPVAIETETEDKVG